jgi:hypothetical protein
MSLEIDIKLENDTESYLFIKEAKLLELALDIRDYTNKYSPWLLEYANTNDLLELLSSFIEIKNPFNNMDEESDTEEEEYDDFTKY